MLAEHQVLPSAPRPNRSEVEMISYRPRRRAVIKVESRPRPVPGTFFVKVLRESLARSDPGSAPVAAGRRLPGAGGLAATADCCVVLREVPGRPLA